MRKFYIQAYVGDFLHENAAFYRGALKEVIKDVNVPGLIKYLHTLTPKIIDEQVDKFRDYPQ